MSDRELSVLMIASEAVPFAKTGGLGDVLGALPRALARLGHRVTVCLPRYRGVLPGDPVADFDVAVGAVTLHARFQRHEIEPRLEVIVVDCPALYDREALYGIASEDYRDNALRFAYLVRAALEYAGRAFAALDIVHAHDWQAGLAPVYLADRYQTHPVLGRASTVLTIHNLAYQGLFAPDVLPTLDLPWELFSVNALEYWGRVSFLKGGINFTNRITTVSPGYAKEIQTPQYGFGFDGILRRRSADLVGILNGIDVDQWDPTRDPALPRPFGPEDLSGKRDAKRALLRAYGMPDHAAAMKRPLIGLVSRMVEQKGFDLLSLAMPKLLKLDAAFVLLGSGDLRFEQVWSEAVAGHPGKVGVRIGFDERLAHLIEGGSDIFLMPSQFEPCGLNQMYSLRYGTVPVVRATGGLGDTVQDFNAKSGKGTGFKFLTYTPAALLRAIRRALDLYAQPDLWRRIEQAGMRQDHSWDASARKYVKVYESAMTRRPPETSSST